MALTGVTTQVLPTGAPALTPAGQLVWGPGDVQEPAFVMTYTAIGDGATTTATVNWIDGTQTIPFTPKAVLAFGIPALSGTQENTGVLKVEGGSGTANRVTSITNVSCTLNFSTAPAANTFSVLLIVYR